MTGFLITFEGGEGSGKSTQIALLAETLRARGLTVVSTREPGGSAGADAIRHVLLSGAAEALGPELEAVLFAAARGDHVAQVIAPALARGEIVVCDRFLDSTRAYQGSDPAVGPDMVASLERAALGGVYPDLTIILDVEAETGLGRAAERRAEADADRFERETLSLHERRRQAFLAIAAREPERCVLIDGAGDRTAVAARVSEVVGERLRAAGIAGADVPAGAPAAGPASPALP